MDLEAALYLLNGDSSRQVANKNGAVDGVRICGKVHLGLGSTRSLQTHCLSNLELDVQVCCGQGRTSTVCRHDRGVWPQKHVQGPLQGMLTMMEI